MALSFEPLRMRWPSGMTATAITVAVVPGAGAHKALVGDAPHLDEAIFAPLMMCWPSGVTATPHRAGVPLEGVDERAVDVVQVDLAGIVVAGVARPTTKCRRRAAPRRSLPRCPPRRCAQQRRRASTASRCGRARR